MKEFKNTRNPILPLDIHIPDSEGHVMPDGKLYLYGEKLKNISDGDEAVFRYVRSNCAYTGIEIRAAGSGRIHVLMNGKNVGTVDIENGQQKNNELSADAGEYELTFRFEAVEDLEVMEIVLHSGRKQ